MYITTKTVDGDEFLSSGFIVDSSGIVITNNHVVRSAKQIDVKTKSGQLYPVTDIIYTNLTKDVCILKIAAYDLPTVPLGNSHSLSVGDKIYVIGNPLGLDYTFSDGMISGLRNFQNLRWLQFTAPISPGNSGGPVINSQGEVVGIVTFLMVGGQNLNFALDMREVTHHISFQPQMSFQKFTEGVSRAANYCQKGLEYGMVKDYQQAKTLFRKAIEVNPDYTEAYANLGFVYIHLEEYSKALPLLQKTIEMEPRHYSAYNALGVTYAKLEDYKKAISYLRKAIEAKPNYALSYGNLGVFYLSKLNEHKKGKVYLQRALEIDPNYADAYSYLGLIYSASHDYEKGLAYCHKAIEINPNVAEFQYTLGFVYKNMKEYGKARPYLYKAKELYRERGNYEWVEFIEQELKEMP